MVLGLAGNSGSGKTAASRALEKLGGFHVDADLLAHEAMAPGTKAYGEIVSYFGPSVLKDPNGPIDRKALGAIVYKDPVKKKALESFVHPVVAERSLELSRELEIPWTFAVWDAALLIESGMHALCDFLWIVRASWETKLIRIQERDGVSQDDAILRLSSQAKEDELAAMAEKALPASRICALPNDGGDLEEKVKDLLEKCQEQYAALIQNA
jgi:dephospho-CoA kinase